MIFAPFADLDGFMMCMIKSQPGDGRLSYSSRDNIMQMALGRINKK